MSGQRVDRLRPDGVGRVRTSAAVLLSFAGGLLLLNGVLQQGPVGDRRWLDVAAGAVASAALVLRRRAPVVVALLLAAAAAVFAAAGVANLVALFAVARRRRLRVTLAVGFVDVVCGCLFWLLYPGNSTFVLTLTVNVALAAAVTAWGALLQSQAALIDSYPRTGRADRTRAAAAGERGPPGRTEPHRAGDARRGRAPGLARGAARRRPRRGREPHPGRRP